MKTTRIEFASNDNQRIATVRRRGEYLLAELFSPEAPNGRKHWIGAVSYTHLTLPTKA